MEIDALFILRNPVGRTLAVHVEFKRDGESFLPGQAEAYRNRARCYRDERRPRPQVLKHNDFVTILFCGTGTDVVSMRGYFDRVVTHAEAHQWIFNYPNPANPGGPTMRERLAALVAFEPVCRAASFRATTGDPVTEPGVYLGVTYSAEVSRFIEMAYEQGWVRALPWSDWRQTVRGNALMHDPDAMADATADELACLLTTCIRADRFCDGYLADAFEAGLIGRAVIRAKQLLEAAT